MDMTQQHYSTQAPIPGSPGLTQTRISGETRTQAQHSIQFAGLMWYLSTENQTENYRITRTLIESNDDDDDGNDNVESYQWWQAKVLAGIFHPFPITHNPPTSHAPRPLGHEIIARNASKWSANSRTQFPTNYFYYHVTWILINGIPALSPAWSPRDIRATRPWDWGSFRNRPHPYRPCPRRTFPP